MRKNEDVLVDYSKMEVLPNYRCRKCGATGVKLWRKPLTSSSPDQDLFCVKCATQTQGLNMGSIKVDRAIASALGRYDIIGFYVPAIPGENGDFQSCIYATEAGIMWWRNLSTFPTKAFSAPKAARPITKTTFTPLKRGWFQCNQTKKRIKRAQIKSYARRRANGENI